MNLFKIFGTIAVNNSEANGAVDETVDKAESASSGIQGAFKKIGAAVVTYFAVDKIKEFGSAIVNASAEVSAEQSAFAQIMGDYSKQAQEKLKAVADSTGMLDTRLTPYMTSMTAKFKGLGYGVEDSTSLAQRGLTLAGDAAAFWDKSLDDSMGGLNSFINGSYEGGEAIGLFANDTQLASYAVAQGIVGETKEWASLDEARKQATRLQYAEDMFKMSGATGQAAKEANQYANVQANLTEKWRQFKAQIGEPVLQNVVLPAMDKLSGVVDLASQKFDQAQPYIQDFGNKIIAAKDTAVELGGYARDTFSPIIDRVGDAFLKCKTFVQPLIDTFTDYIRSGEAASDVTGLLKGAIDLTAGVITGLLDGVTGVAQGFKDMYSWGQKNTDTMQILGLIIGGVTTAVLAYNAAKLIKKALDIIETAQIYGLIAAETAHTAVAAIATGATTAFGIAVAFLTSPITLVILAITALITIGVLLYKNWDVIKEKCQELWANLVEKFTAIKEDVSNAVESMKQAVHDKIESMKQAVTDKVEALKQAVSDKINNMKDAVTSKVESMKQAASDKIESMKQTASTKFEQMKNTMGDLMQNAKDNVSQKLENMKAAYQEKGGGMSGIVSATMTGIRDIYTSAFNVINDLTGGKLGEIVGKFQSGFGQARDVVSGIFDTIKSTISDKINDAKDTVSRAIDSIKSFFNFSWSLPNIELPHPYIKPRGWSVGDLLKGSTPSIGIDWYAKAMDNPMVLDSPTIFGYNPANGSFLGGGEAGQEIVAGAATLQNLIRDAVNSGNGDANSEKIVVILMELCNWCIQGGLETMMVNVLTSKVKVQWKERELARLVKEYA